MMDLLGIQDFDPFCAELTAIFERIQPLSEGRVATYIPQLARANPDTFAMALCTVEGKRFALGDSQVPFSLQSTSKPTNYCLVHEALGEEVVHRHVGREPSGRVFNEISLNAKGLPHNPLINAGAIMCCSLIRPDLGSADRFDHVSHTWERLTGGTRPAFNNAIYLSERQSADRNFALAYLMREHKVFPPDTDLMETLELYFQCCSLELDAEALCVAAATLAAGGICPLTGERVFSARTVRNCLSLMASCGMYDFSGEFAFAIGLPAKSGVSGALMVVIPNVLGLCLYSPPLDQHGNSVRGVAFCRALVERYPFHLFDILAGMGRAD